MREDSIIAWDAEAVFKTPSAAGAWQILGRVDEWTDLGPDKNVYRDAIAGAGREANTIGVAGTAYKPTTLGPFQVQDPRVMGFAWGQEEAAVSAIGGGYYRHTVNPTKNGRLPSMSVQMYDYKDGVLTDGLTYLGVLMPKLSVRGEEASDDGSADSGRIMMAPTLLAHDDASGTAAKTVVAPTATPYGKQHASIQFYNGDIDWRIHSWEFTIDNNAAHNYYHSNLYNGKPTEAPPQGAIYDLRLDIVADGHLNTTSGSLIRDLVRNETKGNAQLKYIRTANQDEFAFNLTDIQILRAPKVRRRGKIHYEIEAAVRATTFEYVDANLTKYFPA